MGHAYFVAMHTKCHRQDLAFQDALKEVHAFLDALSDGLQHLAASYNSSPARVPQPNPLVLVRR